MMMMISSETNKDSLVKYKQNLIFGLYFFPYLQSKCNLHNQPNSTHTKLLKTERMAILNIYNMHLYFR
jgi:hypothetical protein